MARGKAWSGEELLVAFRLYCRLPFGRLHNSNPDIVAVARCLGRTPGSVAMKACNFAALDPAQIARGIKALPNVSAADRSLWREFMTNPEAVAAEAEAVHERLAGTAQASAGFVSEDGDPSIPPTGPSEVDGVARVRRIQGFFRAAVMVSYEGACALSGLAVPALLNASHIIPWSVDVARRADPCNGILLNALYDRAFDRGLITFDEDMRLVVSPSLKAGNIAPFQEAAFTRLEGTRLRPPARFAPDALAMEYHREQVFSLQTPSSYGYSSRISRETDGQRMLRK